MKSLTGRVLVASPSLLDPNFFRSVVLIIQHTDEGTMGLVLNRPTDTSVKEAWERVRESDCTRHGMLHLGGPCESPIMALHNRGLLGSIEVLSGVYCGGDPEQLERLTSDNQGHARFFVGCAGWAPGQLESELDEGAWAVLPAKSEYVFGTSDDLWERLVNSNTAVRLSEMLHIREVPEDPSLN